LMLENNHLTDLPSSIYQMTKLNSLDLKRNALTPETEKKLEEMKSKSKGVISWSHNYMP